MKIIIPVVNAPQPGWPFAWEDLPDLFPGLPEPGRWLPLLRRHALLIERAASRVRVTSVESGAIVRRHYAECLEFLRIALDRCTCESLIDVGSGGGFPGLVVACVLPAAQVQLVEPLGKRARLLEDVALELGLANVRVHAVRAEEAGRGVLRDSAAVVTARAVAELRELIEYTAPLARTGGLAALPKGSGAEAEVVAAARAIAELSCRVLGVEPMRPEISETARIVLLEKAGPTAERYPRRPGMPRKHPLSQLGENRESA